MARPRRPFRRPPPPDPYRLDPVVVEERIEEAPGRRFVENPWLWLGALAVGLAAILIVVIAVLAARDDEPERRTRPRAQPVTVPLAVGADHVEAAAAIEELGLIVDTFPTASEQPAGRVLDQTPAAGTRLRPGERVRLDVSLGAAPLPMTPIPDVTGPRGDAARAELRRAGFTVRTTFRSAPSREELGEVILQGPEAGALAPGLTQVTIYVGS
jgi:beta-lactam-binding protein with PASTA domain